MYRCYPVCSSSEYPTTFGRHLVRRSARFQTQITCREDGGNRSSRHSIPVVLRPLHDRPVVCLRPADAETLYEISDSRLFLSLLLM